MGAFLLITTFMSTCMLSSTVSTESCNPRDSFNNEDYPLMVVDGARWRRFWWFKKGSTWPAAVRDVLQDPYGKCPPQAPYCFGRLPRDLLEYTTEILAKDTSGNTLRWRFEGPSHNTAHQVWKAFHDHVNPTKIVGGKTWVPKVLSGIAPKSSQDSFMYRTEHGVASLLLDDDNCDCLSTLSMGHGMCLTGHTSSHSKANVYGVESLHDPGCHGPNTTNGLEIYFRDDDDCVNVVCPSPQRCVDDVGKYRCIY